MGFLRNTAPLLEGLSREGQLLARCAQTDPSPRATNHILDLVEQPLNWSHVLQQARRHGIEPLLQRHLTLQKDRLPSDVYATLQQRSREVAFRNLRQMQELLRIVEGLEGAGIPVIPFKGPILATRAYGNVAYRPFVDLDVLVPRSKVMDAKAYLQGEGYAPAKNMDPEEEAKYIDTKLGYEFVHPRKSTVVEVHWAFFFEIYTFDLTPDQIWERHQVEVVSDTEIRTLAPEDLLLYLCAHGTKHRWMRLKWIADIAQHIQAADLDWPQVEQRAQRLGLVRMLQLGLHLSDELLDRGGPTHLLKQAKEHRVVRSMARQVCMEWLFQDPYEAPTSDWDVFRFHLKERERWRDRWPYIKYHWKLWLG